MSVWHRVTGIDSFDGYLYAADESMPLTRAPGRRESSPRQLIIEPARVRLQRGFDAFAMDLTGFGASTVVTIDGVSVSNTQFVSAGEIDLTMGGRTELTGKRVVARNPDGTQVAYFAAMPSVADSPANVAIQPLLSTQTWTSASMTYTERGGTIALQNPNDTAVGRAATGFDRGFSIR